MISEFTRPIGIKAEHDVDMEFGVCEKCHDVGVRLLKCDGWVCHKCAYSRMRSDPDIKEVSPTN